MTKIEAIEDEFGESFSDVIKGFARMGYSRTAVADILEFNLSYLRQLLTRFNLHIYFKKQKDMRPESRSGNPNGCRCGGRPVKYSDEYLLGLVATYPEHYIFRSMAPVNVSTVSRRFGMRWRKIVKLATEGQIRPLSDHPSDQGTVTGKDQHNHAPQVF